MNIKKIQVQSSYHAYDFLYENISVSSILPLVNKNIDFILINNFSISLSSLRLKTFAMYGCSCSSCGRVGTHFKLQHNNGDSSKPHLGLWSEDNVQMTKDHIIPKSLGGANHIDNMTTMCEICNGNKGNKCTVEDIKNGVLNPDFTIEQKEIKETKQSVFHKHSVQCKQSDKYLKEYRTIVHNYMVKTKTNPYLCDISSLPSDIALKVKYIKSFYLNIIKHFDGNIPVSNKAFIGLPKRYRSILIEEYLSSK